MKEERNQIKINNPDGLDRRGYGDARRTFANDTSSFVRENSMAGVGETAKPKEHFYAADPKPVAKRRSRAEAQKPVEDTSLGTGTPPAAESANATAAKVTVTNTVAAAVGGGVTAIAGVVAATVVTAVIVVTTFLAVLGVNLSLVMADYTSLTFRLELVTEGEGELEDPYYQATISGDGVSQELTVLAGDFFTFEGLEPDKEYLVTIRDGKGAVQVEKSFCTLAHPIKKGSLEMSVSEGVVTCVVSGVFLKSGEFYTVTVTNEKGTVLFAADDVSEEKTFTFRLTSPTKVKATLGVGGKVQSVAEGEWSAAPEPDPEPILPDYDFESAAWQWAQDYSAVLSVPDKNGGDPLLLTAVVQRERTQADCVKNSFMIYTATVVRDEAEFGDEKRVELQSTALGHDRVFDSFVWGPAGLSDDDAPLVVVGAFSDEPVAYAATARCHCARCGAVLDVTDEVEVTHTYQAASCESDARHIYNATFVNGSETYVDTFEEVVEETALGHLYGEPEFIWTPVYSSDAGSAGGPQTVTGYTAAAKFVCLHDAEHALLIEEGVSVSYADTPAGCESDAYRSFTASLTYEGTAYSDTKVQVFEETAHGHDFTEVSEHFDWGTDESGAVTAAIRAYCSYGCGEYVSVPAEIYMEAEDPAGLCELGSDVTYYAHVMYSDSFYEEVREAENVVLGHDYGSPAFEWTPDGSNYYATAYFVCSRCLDHTVTVQSSNAISQNLSDGGRIYTVTVSFNDQTYWARKEVHPGRAVSKAPAVGVSYKVGDRILMESDTYFKEGDAPGDVVTVAHYTGSTVILYFDIDVEGDYTILLKDYFTDTPTESLYVWENGSRGDQIPGWSVWFSNIFVGDEVRSPVGITIVSGSGTSSDPFVLAPLYGKTVTFDYGNGENSVLYFSEEEMEDGDVYAVVPTADPKRPGHVFIGWSLDGEPYDFETPVTDNLVLSPDWWQVAETVTVYFMVDGSPYEVQEVLLGGRATRPADPERENYTVAGWYSDNDAVLFDFDATVTDTLFLYVKWEPSA